MRPALSNRALLVGCLLACASGCAGKPGLELHEARSAVAAARDFEADVYAPEEYDRAVMWLEMGEDAIARQDEMPFWSRNYSDSLDYLARAGTEAEQAQ